jgi:protein SCO1/2
VTLSRRAALASFAALALAAQASAQTADPLARRFGGPFTLTSHTGARVSDRDFRGRLMLVYFGFTNCADTCPGDLLTIGHALERLGAAQERIQPLFVTVDPETDTPEAMATYLEHFHPRIVGLTGSEAEIAAVTKAYRVHRRLLDIPKRSDAAATIHLAHGPGGHGPGAHGPYRGGAQTIDHGSLTYLMGPDGGFLTLFPTNADDAKMASILASYLARIPG